MFEHLWEGIRKLYFSDRVEAQKKRGDPRPDYSVDNDARMVKRELDANLICSISERSPVNGRNWHFPVLDIDYEAFLLPSRTPGHSHLYLNVPVSEPHYWELLDILAKCGLIERGYAEASKKKGYTAARIPSAQTRYDQLNEEGGDSNS